MEFDQYQRYNRSYLARDLVRRMLEKDPNKRPTAIELSQHLWFSQVEVESVKSSTKTQISLHRTVHRIKRGIMKRKEKKACKKLEDLFTAEDSLSPTRMNFLVEDASETASQMAESI